MSRLTDTLDSIVRKGPGGNVAISRIEKDGVSARVVITTLIFVVHGADEIAEIDAWQKAHGG